MFKTFTTYTISPLITGVQKKGVRNIIIAFLLSFCCTISTYCQPLPDSVLTKYKSFSVQKKQKEFLADYLQHVLYFDNKGIEKGIKLSSFFKKQNDESAADLTMLFVAGKLAESGNYVNALNMSFSILSRFEQRKDTVGLAYSSLSIAYCYNASQNYKQAIVYYKKAIPFAISIGNKKFIAHLYNNIGATYAYTSMPDSGLVYAQKSVTLSTQIKYDIFLSYFLSSVAENYIAKKDYDLALPFLRRAANYAHKFSDGMAMANINNDFAQAFIGLKKYDSARYHIHQAIKYYSKNDGQPGLLRSYQYLNQCYEETNKPDSANKYFRLAAIVKDSLFSIEKTKLVHSLSFTEQLRQQELENERINLEKERKHNIQYVLIAIGIVSFAILFLLLSRSVISNTKVIEFLGVLALLVVFEFLNLLLHPLLERVTHHSPLLMLLALVCIAALLIPLHHKLEKWTTRKLVEKNKAIRLAKAKKTIEKLEKNDNTSID